MFSVKTFCLSHRRLFTTCLFIASAGIFAGGLVRLLDYSQPMLAGNYKVAAAYKTSYVAPPSDDPAETQGSVEPSGYDLAGVWLDHRLNDYRDGMVGSRVLAVFDYGWQLYRKGAHDSALNVLQNAFAGCCDESGNIVPGFEQLASDIQLLLGNIYVDRKKTDNAIAVYEVSLALNPDNIVATYNLECLKESSRRGSRGGRGKDGDPVPVSSERGI